MLADDSLSIPVSAVDFSVAGLVFDADLVCRFATPEACALFGGLEPRGLSAASLFADWLTQPRLRDAVNTTSIAHHSTGRQFHCACRLGVDGRMRLVLTDISTQAHHVATADYDLLTGLPQRGALIARLDHLIAKTANDVALAVHHLDLDRFKGVNEALGHAIGDRLLAKVAGRIHTLLQPGHIAARLGGDEFILVQTEVDSVADAAAFASRLVDLIGRTYVIQGHVLNIGASVGVALAHRDGNDAETLLRHADLAVYRAKAEGRGTARFFEPQMNARTQTRRLLESDLRLALALRQFRLHFQPLYNLASDRITGFEALLRWNHPKRGAVSPADFIPLAEEVGLISQIGEWVLRSACREAMSWPSPASVAVNISPCQFKGDRLVDTVVAALAATGLPAERLELEITEGALLDDTDLVLKTLHRLRGLGVRIAMDDFGTGYSSLSYIRKFPFDKIKIDQSFVRGLGIDGECDAILKAVSTLGASLGMRTTAEGVETADQLHRVRQENCTEVQGFFTGRPIEAADARALLGRQGGQS